MPISALAKRMADIAQLTTQYVGSRPMGVAIILVGMEQDDDGVCAGGGGLFLCFFLAILAKILFFCAF